MHILFKAKHFFFRRTCFFSPIITNPRQVKTFYITASAGLNLNMEYFPVSCTCFIFFGKFNNFPSFVITCLVNFFSIRDEMPFQEVLAEICRIIFNNASFLLLKLCQIINRGMFRFDRWQYLHQNLASKTKYFINYCKKLYTILMPNFFFNIEGLIQN